MPGAGPSLPSTPDATLPLLSVQGLGVEFRTRRGVARVLDDVGFELQRGQTLGVVGESGCGKSVTALAVMRLISQPPGRITGGRVLFDGRDLLSLPEDEMRRVRGNRISMIFQEPMTSLNPAYTVGDQIAEAVRLHEGLSRAASIASGTTIEAPRWVMVPETLITGRRPMRVRMSDRETIAGSPMGVSSRCARGMRAGARGADRPARPAACRRRPRARRP